MTRRDLSYILRERKPIEVWECVSAEEDCECGMTVMQKRRRMFRGRYYAWVDAFRATSMDGRCVVRHFYQRRHPAGRVVQLLVGYRADEL